MTKVTTNPFRFLAVPAIALGLAAPLATAPAFAGEDKQDYPAIEVTSKSEMQRWKKQVSRRLDQALLRTEQRQSGAPDSGIVQVTFELGANGRADNVSVYSNSADRTAARIAKQAIKRLPNLADAPVTNVREARFLANIIFADDQLEHSQLAEALAQSERARLASGADQDDVIVLGG